MEYTIEIYRLDLTTNQFTLIDQVITFQRLSFSKAINNVGRATFTMSIYDDKATASNFTRFRNVVVIKKNESIVWAGFINKVAGEVAGAGGGVQIECMEYFGRLFTRFTDELRTFTNVDAGVIASTLISETQAKPNGNLRFQDGVIETIVNKDRTYEYKSVGDAIIDLTQVTTSPIFFVVNPIADALTKKLDYFEFNVFNNIGSVRDDLPDLEVGINVNTVKFITSDTLVNAVTGLGAGTGEETISSLQEDPGSQVEYTRIERVLPSKSIVLQDTLDEQTGEYLDENKDERYLIDLELMPGQPPVFGDYQLGDILNLDLQTTPSSMINFNQQARVEEITVNIDEVGAEFVTPKLNLIF